MIHLLLKNKQMKAKVAILIIFFGIFLFNSFISLKKKDITVIEIESLGNGVALYHNVKNSNESRFAILIPPLPGVTTLFPILQSPEIAALPSGDYSDLVSYMYALSIPMTLGESFRAPEMDLKLSMRWKNIVCFIGIFIILFCKKEYILTLVMMFFFTIFSDFIISTSQVLCALFVIWSAHLMTSLLNYSKEKWKFILLGLLCSLTVGSFGINGLILHGVGIASPIIIYDLQHKTLNRGFKKYWVIGFLLYFLVALLATWAMYGFYLEKFSVVAGMFGYKSSIELRIIPFYDSIKQTVFEVIFKDKFNEYCIKYNLITLWSSLIVFLPILIYKFKSLKWQAFFPISLLIIAIFFNDRDQQKVRLFLETVSIIFPAAVIFAIAESRSVKNT
jgi:hypothetical protein